MLYMPTKDCHALTSSTGPPFHDLWNCHGNSPRWSVCYTRRMPMTQVIINMTVLFLTVLIKTLGLQIPLHSLYLPLDIREASEEKNNCCQLHPFAKFILKCLVHKRGCIHVSLSLASIWPGCSASGVSGSVCAHGSQSSRFTNFSQVHATRSSQLYFLVIAVSNDRWHDRQVKTRRMGLMPCNSHHWDNVSWIFS